MSEAAARREVERLLRQLNTAITQQRVAALKGHDTSAADFAVELLRESLNAAQHRLIIIQNGDE